MQENIYLSKHIYQFSEILNIKPKTSVLVLGAVKTYRKLTSKDNLLWLDIQKRRGWKKINAQVKQSLENLTIFLNTTYEKEGVKNTKIYMQYEPLGPVGSNHGSLPKHTATSPRL